MASISGAFSSFSPLLRSHRHQSGVISAFPLRHFHLPQSIVELSSSSSPSYPSSSCNNSLKSEPELSESELVMLELHALSGGTPKITNGLLEVQKAFRDAGLDFLKQLFISGRYF